MSDESTTPPLRLRPRLRIEPGQTDTGAAEAGDFPPPSHEPAPAPSIPASGEPPLSKLRLKPKLGVIPQDSPTGGSEPIAPSEPEPAPPAFSPAESLRTKLRLAPTPVAEPGAAANEPADFPPLPEPEPRIPAPVPELPKFKLKPPLPEPIPTASRTPFPTPAPTAIPTPAMPGPPTLIPPEPPIPTVASVRPSGITSAPFPVVATPVPPPVPMVPHLRAPGSIKEDDLNIAAKDTSPRAKKKSLLLPGLAAVLVIAAGAGYVMLRPTTPKPSPAAPPAVTAKPVTVQPSAPTPPAEVPPAPAAEPSTVTPAAQKEGPTPSATLNAIAAAPAQTLAKAQTVVTARQKLESDRSEVLAGDTPAPTRTATPPPVTAPTRAPASNAVPITSTTQVAPGVTVTSKTSELRGVASAAFRSWVSNAQINGVFNGQPPRALINGRTFRAGQPVDEALGIVFESLDPKARAITFRDRTGAIVTRRY